MISFPKGTAAERVVSGILAIHNRLERTSAPRVSEPIADLAGLGDLEPYVPHPALEGGQLDVALSQPPPPELAPPDPLTAGVARGDDLLEQV